MVRLVLEDGGFRVEDTGVGIPAVGAAAPRFGCASHLDVFFILI
ncbi:hypothetical protein [Aromatoleum bremense]|nr:hypothetical protein [Aromatoleum bremense]QTQ32001.1 Uncharacterized protein pbN1_20110 [Aromatoleum bremense]